MSPSLRSPLIALLVAVELLFIPLFLLWVFLLILLGRRDSWVIPVFGRPTLHRQR